MKGRHTKDSHKGAVIGRITDTQKAALATIVRTNPLCKAQIARRATQNMDDEAKIAPEMMNSIKKNVWKIRNEYYTEKLEMQMSGKFEDLDAFEKTELYCKSCQSSQ